MSSSKGVNMINIHTMLKFDNLMVKTKAFNFFNNLYINAISIVTKAIQKVLSLTQKKEP